MLEMQGDLFTAPADAICIPTNGHVNAYGRNTMGVGVAGEVVKRRPFVPQILGARLQSDGNHVHLLTRKDRRLYWENQIQALPYHLVSFPTKPTSVDDPSRLLPRYQSQFRGNPLPGWMAQSDLELIEWSALELRELTSKEGWTRVALPHVGCGAGGLNWNTQVRPLLQGLLDDRFWFVSL